MSWLHSSIELGASGRVCFPITTNQNQTKRCFLTPLSSLESAILLFHVLCLYSVCCPLRQNFFLLPAPTCFTWTKNTCTFYEEVYRWIGFAITLPMRWPPLPATILCPWALRRPVNFRVLLSIVPTLAQVFLCSCIIAVHVLLYSAALITSHAEEIDLVANGGASEVIMSSCNYIRIQEMNLPRQCFYIHTNDAHVIQ